MGYYFCLPQPLFQDPLSVVVEGTNHQLLGARIAQDQQWRFPEVDSVPFKLKQAIITFEDKRFYKHPGVDPLALGRAIQLNISKGAVKSGASTITMQVIRLHRKNRGRTLIEKLIEFTLATRLELSLSKDQILNLYMSHAPFGGNVVGVGTASWKYFNKPPHLLSWAESTVLAVLPNSPSLIHPGKNRNKLLKKRNKLLYRLYENGVMDSLTMAISQAEPLPIKPLPLADIAPHLTEKIRAKKEQNQSIYRTWIDADLQRQITHLVNQRSYHLQQNGINNAAALVIDLKGNKIKAYVGNVDPYKNANESSVDMITSYRSTGSIIKPMLYAASLEEGLILPHSLYADVPTYFHGFRPKNYDKTYSGAVAMSEALSSSLNVPFVRLLSEYGQKKFYHKLKEIGMSSLTQSSSHYGLSLILGGAEVSMWDLGKMYAGMASTVNQYNEHSGNKAITNQYQLALLQNQSHLDSSAAIPFSASSIWLTLEAMLKVNRPNLEQYWQNFHSSKKIAWKTGTSFGFRDAWAVGITPGHVVVVWVGNADGEGRPELIGAKAAGPLLFDIFQMLPDEPEWFYQPYDEMEQVVTCKHSGQRVQPTCFDTLTTWVPNVSVRNKPCNFCKTVHLDQKGENQVNGDCYEIHEMTHKSYFVLPPMQEWYYRKKHPSHTPLPPFLKTCKQFSEEKNLQIVYPNPGTRIVIPLDVDGVKSKTVFEATHREKNTKLYWHIDDVYLGETKHFHEMAVEPEEGKHTLTIVDSKGESTQVNFEILTLGK